MSAKIPTASLSILENAENTLGFLHISLTSREKKIFIPKGLIPVKLFPYSTIFHDCA